MDQRELIVVENFSRWMPDGKGGYMPAPEIMSEAEVIRFLRLDESGAKHPKETLRRYRKKFGLKAVQLGKSVRFPLQEVCVFIKLLSEKNPREGKINLTVLVNNIY